MYRPGVCSGHVTAELKYMYHPADDVCTRGAPIDISQMNATSYRHGWLTWASNGEAPMSLPDRVKIWLTSVPKFGPKLPPEDFSVGDI